MSSSDEKPDKVHKLVKKENDPDPQELLKPTKADIAHSGIKAGLSSIPVVGGSLAEIFSFGVESPLQKRRNNFIIRLDERIRNLENLKNDDEFIDIVTHALQIALRNYSSEEKISSLVNAVTNTAHKINVNTDSKFMYLNYINDLTQIQLRIIKILNDPRKIIEKLFEANKGNNKEMTYVDVLKDLQKFLKVDKVLYDASIKRLETDGLIDLSDKVPGAPIGAWDEHSIWLGIDELEIRTKSLITPFGKQFIKFISENSGSKGE